MSTQALGQSHLQMLLNQLLEATSNHLSYTEETLRKNYTLSSSNLRVSLHTLGLQHENSLQAVAGICKEFFSALRSLHFAMQQHQDHIETRRKICEAIAPLITLNQENLLEERSISFLDTETQSWTQVCVRTYFIYLYREDRTTAQIALAERLYPLPEFTDLSNDIQVTVSDRIHTVTTLMNSLNEVTHVNKKLRLDFPTPPPSASSILIRDPTGELRRKLRAVPRIDYKALAQNGRSPV